MREPSLLDVFKAIVTSRRGMISILVFVAAYLALSFLNASLALWGRLALTVLAAVALLVELVARFPQQMPSMVASGEAPSVVSFPQVRLEFHGAEVWRSLRLMLALIAAFAAQTMMFNDPANYWTGIALWAAAIALAYPLLRARPEAAVEAPVVVEQPVNWLWAAVGAGLSVVAFLSAGGNRFTPLAVVPWLLSVVLWPLALAGWRPQPEAWLARLAARARAFKFDTLRVQFSWTAVAIVAVFALGAYLRFYDLNDVPREMTSDHVEKLLDINDVLHGQYSIFFYRNTGREPFQFYYTVALTRLFNLPLAHLTLKIGTALAGSATLIFVFLLARELGGTEAGLWTMLLSAIARWPIALSRAGLRYPFAPLFAAPALYFLARGFKSGRRSDFLWAGLCAGVGLQGYSSFRVVPLLIVVLVGLWLLRSGQTRESRLRLLGQFAMLVSVTLVTCVPLLRFMLDRPDLFWERIMTRIGTTEQPLPGNPLSLLWQNLYRVFLMFNYTRDEVWTVNISNWPALSPLLAALFGLGLIALVVRAVRREGSATFVIVAWIMLLLPSALSLAFPKENPSVARAGIAFPFVFFIAAWPLAWIRREAVKHWPGWGGRIAAAAGLAVIVGSLARTNFHDYFVTFRDQYDMSATNPSEIGTVVRAFVAGGVSPDSVWLKGFPYWLDARAVALESFDSFDWQNAVLDPEELTKAGDDARPKLFIVHIWDQPAIAKLRELYPNGILANHTSPTPGKDFLTYFVPGAEDFDENTLPTPPGASLSPGRS